MTNMSIVQFAKDVLGITLTEDLERKLLIHSKGGAVVFTKDEDQKLIFEIVSKYNSKE